MNPPAHLKYWIFGGAMMACAAASAASYPGHPTTTAEITAAVLRAVETNKASVRLPRRTAPISYLVDAARRSTWAVAHGLTTPPRPS